MVIRRNTLDPRDPVTGDAGNAAVQLGSETGTMVSRNVVIEGNYIDGGNCPVNVRADINGSNIVVRANRFGPNSKYTQVIGPRLVSVTTDNVMDVWGTKIAITWTN